MDVVSITLMVAVPLVLVWAAIMVLSSCVYARAKGHPAILSPSDEMPPLIPAVLAPTPRYSDVPRSPLRRPIPTIPSISIDYSHPTVWKPAISRVKSIRQCLQQRSLYPASSQPSTFPQRTDAIYITAPSLQPSLQPQAISRPTPIPSIIPITFPHNSTTSPVTVITTEVLQPPPSLGWQARYKAHHGHSPMSSPHDRELAEIRSYGPYPWQEFSWPSDMGPHATVSPKVTFLQPPEITFVSIMSVPPSPMSTHFP
jgi:hypothetical protein